MPDRVIHVQVTGLEETKHVFQQLAMMAPRALARGMYVEGEKIMTASKKEVPVDTGALMGTGRVIPPDPTAAEPEVKIVYGGPSGVTNPRTGEYVGYALWVHERLDQYHKPPRKAKFLEDPAKAAIPGMDERIAAEMRKELP